MSWHSRFARESEDLPPARTPSRVRGGSVVSWEDPPGLTAHPWSLRFPRAIRRSIGTLARRET
ncbi:hypothetical protein EV649_0868 [Kribbella sp. VKM Ac-2569]|nr:hypothetical protein EV649_0868 [Kribbella sp. VKM Ac-2569]